MPRTTVPDPNRARQACETCREKKRKCPGEKPFCSLCQRLKQRCSYSDRPINYNRQRGRASSERGNSEDRLRRLEWHMEKVYGILDAIKQESHQDAGDAPLSLHNAEASHDRTFPASIAVDASEADMVSLYSGACNRTWNIDSSTIARAVEVYISKIHCQPLPLFEVLNLRSDATVWPRCLLLSLIVITSRLSPDVMPGWSAKERRDCHRQARCELMIKVVDNAGHLEILQSFCLLILEEIAEQDKHTAWLDIGVGAQLATANSLPPSSHQTSKWARACWSLYVLDHIYNSGFSTVRAFPDDFDLCDYPQSHPLPQTNLTSEVQYDSRSAQSQRPAVTDVDACCVSLLSVWSYTMTFLRDVKENGHSIAWSEHEGYQYVLVKLYQFEASVAQPHRLWNAQVDERSSLQLKEERGYWASWLTMQFLYHAIHATMNHPFLHIEERRKGRSAPLSSCWQHTADQMLLHAGWVTKFIDLCAEKDFTINDPFVAHLVSIVAAGYLFFLNNNDSELAGQAQRGFKTCYSFIERSAGVWAHLTNTVYRLNILKRQSDDYCSVNDQTSIHPARTSLLWSLFDYSSSTTLINTFSFSTDAQAAVDSGSSTQFLTLINSVHTPPEQPSGSQSD